MRACSSMVERGLPEFNRLVVARLVGASHHTGEFPAWHREGWAFMVRWDGGQWTVADDWAADRYEAALKQIDADYASVVEWVYVDNLSQFSTQVKPQAKGRVSGDSPRPLDSNSQQGN